MTEPRDEVVLMPTPLDRLEWVVTLEADPDTSPFIVPWPLERHRRALDDPDLAHLLVTDPEGPVGFAILAGMGGARSVIELRRMVVAPALRGRGLGRASLRRLIAYAFDELGAHRLWLDVVVENRRAKRLYRSEGFRTEGVLRDHLPAGGGFRSLEVMSMLAPERREGRPREPCRS